MTGVAVKQGRKMNMIEAAVCIKTHTHKRTGRPPKVQRFAPSLSEREGHGRL